MGLDKREFHLTAGEGNEDRGRSGKEEESLGHGAGTETIVTSRNV